MAQVDATRSQCLPRFLRSGRHGFTLVELAVVMGIVVLLLGLTATAVFVAQKQGNQVRVASDLQAIAMALEAYKADFKEYPKVVRDPALLEDDHNPTTPLPPGYDIDRPNPPMGAQILCRTLVGPAPRVDPNPPGSTDIAEAQDGADGPGFRVRGEGSSASGPVYGPYINTDRFKLGDPEFPDRATPAVLKLTILDGNGRPILYFPASQLSVRPDVSRSNMFFVRNEVAHGGRERSLYDVDDNLHLMLDAKMTVEIEGEETPAAVSALPVFQRFGEPDDTNAIRRIQIMLGDVNFNGVIDGDERARFTGAYILWSAGDDGRFGPDIVHDSSVPNYTRKNTEAADKCDDVLNFNAQLSS